MNLPEEVDAAIKLHAAEEYPRESCGLVIVRKGRMRYMPCRNIAERNEHFVLHAEDYASAEDEGEIVMVVHSHPNVAPLPSQADMVGCEKSGIPWLIVNWPTGRMFRFEPTGYTAPLTGRVFSHGILDCFSLIRDYYTEVLGVTLPDFERPDEWWLKGLNLYLDGFGHAGFERVDDAPRTHDVLLMKVASPVPNHAAVYLGDGKILHHQMGRLSSRDVFGGWYKKISIATLRHQTQIP